MLPTSRKRSGRGLRTLIDRNGLETFRRESADILSFRAANRMLGIPQVPFVDLATRGLIERRGESVAEAQFSWLFSRSQIAGLIDSVFARCPATPTGDVFCGTGDLLAGAEARFSGSELVEAVLSGELPLAGLDRRRNGLDQCLFSPPEVEKALRKRQGVPDDAIRRDEVARRLGLPEDVVCHR